MCLVVIPVDTTIVVSCNHLLLLYFLPRIPLSLRVSNLSTPIHYSQVRCTGEQKSLLDCQISEITTECTHDRDVAIVCRRSEKGICIGLWVLNIAEGINRSGHSD